MFQTLICSEELNRDVLIHEKLQSWEKSGLQLVLLPCDIEKWSRLDMSKALWIVTKNEEWDMGKAKGIAMLPYVPGLEEMSDWKLPSFPKAENIISGFDDLDLEYLDRVFRREHNLPWIIAEEEDYILREFVMSDLDGLFALYEDETLYPFVEHLFDRKQEEEYEQQYIHNMYRLLGYGMWLVCDKQTGRIIGRAGLENRDYGDSTGLEMGYLIHRDYRGKGLGSRVCKRILEYAKKELSFREVNCLIHEENIASIAFAQKLGFHFSEKILDHGIEMFRYKMDL